MSQRRANSEKSRGLRAQGNLGPTSARRINRRPVAAIPTGVTIQLIGFLPANLRRASGGPSLLPFCRPLPGMVRAQGNFTLVSPL